MIVVFLLCIIGSFLYAMCVAYIFDMSPDNAAYLFLGLVCLCLGVKILAELEEDDD